MLTDDTVPTSNYAALTVFAVVIDCPVEVMFDIADVTSIEVGCTVIEASVFSNCVGDSILVRSENGVA